MKYGNSSNCNRDCNRDGDHGPMPYCIDIAKEACRNTNFRTAFWTGTHLQMTLMSVPVRGDIGLEMHPDTDQLIRVEEGQALVRMGRCKEQAETQCCLRTGDAVFIPCGTWHNIFNNGNCPLKLSSVYAPPHHPRGTVHRTKEDAKEEY